MDSGKRECGRGRGGEKGMKCRILAECGRKTVCKEKSTKIGENEVELLRRQFGKDCTTICRGRGVYKEVNLQWKF